MEFHEKRFDSVLFFRVFWLYMEEEAFLRVFLEY